MKKFGFILAVLLVLTSCSKDETMVDNGGMKECLYASMEQGIASRIAIKDDSRLFWTNTDAICVYDVNGVSKDWDLFKIHDNGDGVFRGEALDAKCLGAIFPAVWGGEMSGHVLKVQLPEVLNANTFIAPMWSSIESLAKVTQFKHLGAILKINIKGVPLGYNRLFVEADKPIAGMFGLDMSESEKVLAGVSAGQNKNTVIIGNLKDGDNVVYVPLPVATYNSMKVTLDNGLKQVLLKEWKNERTVDRAYLYHMDFQVSGATTPQELTSDLVAVAQENSHSELILTESIDATQGGDVILQTIKDEETETILECKEVPITDEQHPLYIKEDGNNVTEGNKVYIAFPAEENNPIYLDLDTPNTTFTLVSGCFGTLTAITASNTLIFEGGVKAEKVIVKGGKVLVKKGCIVQSIEAVGTSETIIVDVEEGGKVISYGDGVSVIENITNSGENSDVTNGTWDTEEEKLN